MLDQEYDAIVTCAHGSWEIKSWEHKDYKLPCGCLFDEDPSQNPVLDTDWVVSVHADVKEWE